MCTRTHSPARRSGRCAGQFFFSVSRSTPTASAEAPRRSECIQRAHLTETFSDAAPRFDLALSIRRRHAPKSSQTCVVEAADARAREDARDERGCAADHVHDAAPRKVQHAHIEQPATAEPPCAQQEPRDEWARAAVIVDCPLWNLEQPIRSSRQKYRRHVQRYSGESRTVNPPHAGTSRRRCERPRPSRSSTMPNGRRTCV